MLTVYSTSTKVTNTKSMQLTLLMKTMLLALCRTSRHLGQNCTFWYIRITAQIKQMAEKNIQWIITTDVLTTKWSINNIFWRLTIVVCLRHT